MSNIGVTSSITRMGTVEPFALQVSRGQIPGHSPLYIFGFQTAVDSTAIPIWENAAAYVYPTSATVMTVVSDSASDNTAASVLIQGLDAGYNPVSETIALNGVTGVTTANKYFRINNLYLASAGTGQMNNVGTITVKQGTNVVAQINPTVSKSQATIYTVPAGYSFHLMYAGVSTSAGYGGDYATYNVQQIVNGVERNILQQPFTSLFTSDKHAIPFPFQEKSDLQWLVNYSSGTDTIEVGVIIAGILVNNYINGSTG